MKRSSDLSQATASDNGDAPDALPLEVPGLAVAALPSGSTTFQVNNNNNNNNGPEVLPPELPERSSFGQEQTFKDNKAEHYSHHGPSNGTDNGLQLLYPPGVLIDSPANEISIPEPISASRQPGAEHVTGMLPTSFHNVVNENTNLPREQQEGETTHQLIAVLVDPAPIAEVISDAELKAAYQTRCRTPPWRKFLFTGGLILLVVTVIIVVIVIVTGGGSDPDPDPSNQIRMALNPVLPDSSKIAINQVGTPQNKAFQWLETRIRYGVDSLSDDRVRQLYALATLYYATTGSQWFHQFGWLTSDDECNWYFSNGTNICNNGVLTMLDMDINNLNGFLPPDIAMLTKLTYLDLGHNLLNGTIPSSFGQLTSLKYLDLYFNGLTGTIPSALGQLTSLTELYVSLNTLTGTIPSTIGQLTNLKYFNVRNNTLTGTIPSSLSQLTRLTSLDLFNNELTGAISSSLDQLTSLKSTWLFNNELTGTIPSNVCAFVNLTDARVDCDKVTCDCCACS